MKKQPTQYLKYTILVITNSILIQLLDMILNLTTPCATIYIVGSMDKANALFNTLDRNNSLEINAYLLIQEIKYITAN